MAGRPAISRLCLSTSAEAHFSVARNSAVIGIGEENVRKISTDNQLRMDPEALEKAIKENLERGRQPICIVATLGTTSTTSSDPIPEIANIAEKYNLWLHIDAAYAGAAALLPEKHYLFEDWQRADSIVVNPHKWLFTPLHCSCFYFRQPRDIFNSFSHANIPYLKAEVADFMNYTFQLGKEPWAFRLWPVLGYFAEDGLRASLRNHIQLANKFANWIEEHPDFELAAPVPLSVVCFQFRPKQLEKEISRSGKTGIQKELNQLNKELLKAINNTGKVFLWYTQLNGIYALRLAIGNIKTKEKHIRLAWEIIQEKATLLSSRLRK